jgi:hypothetical protein
VKTHQLYSSFYILVFATVLYSRRCQEGFIRTRWRLPPTAKCRPDDQINDDLRPSLLAFRFKKGQRVLYFRNPTGWYRDQQMTTFPAIRATCDLHV